MYQNKQYVLTERDPKKICGFVYLVTNLVSEKKYVGKKLFWSSKSRMIRGKKKKFKAESDWQSYFGSSDRVRTDLAALGPDKFLREILHICYSKSECSYLETREQFNRNVLLRPSEYYNEWVTCKITRKHLKNLTENYKSSPEHASKPPVTSDLPAENK